MIHIAPYYELIKANVSIYHMSTYCLTGAIWFHMSTYKFIVSKIEAHVIISTMKMTMTSH